MRLGPGWGWGSGCAEEAGKRGDGFEQQGIEAGLLIGGAAGAELGDGARRCPAWAASWRTRAATAGFEGGRAADAATTMSAAQAVRCAAGGDGFAFTPADLGETVPGYLWTASDGSAIWYEVRKIA